MQFTCHRCGTRSTISSASARAPLCSRCKQPLTAAVDGAVPADDSADEPQDNAQPNCWWEYSISTLVSLGFHLVLIIVLALITYDGWGGVGIGEEVLIGELPSEILSDSSHEELSSSEAAATTASESARDEMVLEEVRPPVSEASDAPLSETLSLVSPSSTGGDPGSFQELGAVSVGGGSMAGGSWDGFLQNLRRNGLDIVITFDSTGSMGGEISQVKRQIRRIGGTLLKLVPKARIGLCTYRDRDDEYEVAGLPLTNDLRLIDEFLASTYADGGGDEPEAVHTGLQWSITNNPFHANSRKVILLFGDAPPHPQFRTTCLRLASDFQQQRKGIVSTVTCRAGSRLPEFVEIAAAGGGEAFLTSDERQIMRQLLVLVFGSRYRDKVLEAFDVE